MRNHAICKVALKYLIVVCSCRRRFTVLNFKSWAFRRICSRCQQHFTAHAQPETAINELAVKFLTLSFDSPHLTSLQGTKFRRFGDVFRWLFCIFYTECPPHFYFRFVWPTDLESIPHTSTPMAIIPTKFEVDMIIHCRVKNVLPGDALRDFATLTFDLFTLNSCHTRRVTCPTLPPSLKTLCLFVLELWVITSFTGYHWHCVFGYCAFGYLCIGGKFYTHIWNPQPQVVYSLWSFGGSTMKVNKRSMPK